jgi:hypothetical protein
MAGGIDWFRWHHGTVTDPKFALVARRAGASLPDVLAVWSYLLETASASDERGTFTEVDCEAWDCLFGFPATETRTADIMAAMKDRGLIGDGVVVKWEKRQPKRERDTDNSADRTRAYRERHKQQGETEQNHVTPCDATERQRNARGEESREEKRREEKDTLSENIVGAAAAAPTTAKKGKRLADDWQLPKPWGEWALAEYPAWTADIVRLEAAKFADHWHAKAGKDAVKLDWEATWRMWCRSDICQRTHGLKPTYAQQAADVARTTVPSRRDRDPVLVQIEADAAKAAPIPDAVRALANRLKVVA